MNIVEALHAHLYPNRHSPTQRSKAVIILRSHILSLINSVAITNGVVYEIDDRFNITPTGNQSPRDPHVTIDFSQSAQPKAYVVCNRGRNDRKLGSGRIQYKIDNIGMFDVKAVHDKIMEWTAENSKHDKELEEQNRRQKDATKMLRNRLAAAGIEYDGYSAKLKNGVTIDVSCSDMNTVSVERAIIHARLSVDDTANFILALNQIKI